MPSFCPAPYFQGALVAPCLLDTISASILVVVAMYVLYMARSSRRNSSDPERTSLLNNNRNAAEANITTSTTPTLNIILIFTLGILLSLVTTLIVDALFLFTPSPTTLPQLTFLPPRILADSFTFLAWILFASSLILSPIFTSSPFQFVAFTLDLIQAYQWTIILSSPNPVSFISTLATSPVNSLLDITFSVSFIVRFILTTFILIFTVASKPATATPVPDLEDAEEGEANKKSQKKNTSSWALTVKNFGKLLPFMWPKGFYLQSMVGLSFLMLIAGRVVNVAVPWQYKLMVDSLLDPNNENKGPYYVWGAILTYCFFRYLQGSVGLVTTLQNIFWIPVAQYNAREISVTMLRHLHNLSLQFHINRKTGEVLRVMDRGTSSVSSLLSGIVFSIFPIFVDIGVAVIFLIAAFDLSAGLVVFATMSFYIALTIIITEWRTKFRREMNDLDNLSRARAVDSLLNFETVKYYNNEDYEVTRFEDSIKNYQVADWKSNASMYFLNTAQNTVITLGMVIGTLLIAKRVVDGELTVGHFIMFVTYLIQLYQPLNWLGTYYRVIQQNFIDMESMFELFSEHPDVKDASDATELRVSEGGTVVFDDVSFAYDARQPAIKNLSFEVPSRSTVALVGATGSGKSTVFRLLFRFYNPTSGRILIDGQDISKVTQKSLRKVVGVVPQDTVLFNETIAYNIAYGDTKKNDDAVIDAAKMAQIHDKITTFPDGYETRVGERGLRLSGGEKQRVAIARTMLKNPDIILLDEATSALDNTTEALIQRSLKQLTSRKTTLVIAHRLSTVVDADLILVMKDGRIVERGTHAELLKRGEEAAKPDGIDEEGRGTYYSMWMRQMEEVSEKQAEVADKIMPVKRGKGVGAGGANYHGGHGGGGGGFH